MKNRFKITTKIKLLFWYYISCPYNVTIQIGPVEHKFKLTDIAVSFTNFCYQYKHLTLQNRPGYLDMTIKEILNFKL